MPTYTIHAASDCLPTGKRADLARAIAALHSEHTGAPRSFVQTIFLTVEPGTHFIGDQAAASGSVWVYGHIRSGRSTAVRTALAQAIASAIEESAGIPRHYIWVYLNELTCTDMIEFGAVLPQPGEEEGWVARLDPAVRDYLRSLG
jgi:phenylpyruvate tautomerase PptA (4-oxalocrotonate tautomerase family)